MTHAEEIARVLAERHLSAQARRLAAEMQARVEAEAALLSYLRARPVEATQDALRFVRGKR